MALSTRTLIVLGSLLAAMTLASGVLLVLQPAPVAPLTHIRLLSTDRAVDPADQLFATTSPVQHGRWQAITISYSGAAYGSGSTVAQQHEYLGLRGLGHHFVIGNGTASPDGEIEVGFRWQHQLPSGLPVSQAAGDQQSIIQICLIGDGRKAPPTDSQLRELLWLVRNLQLRTGIPSSKVGLIDAGPFAVGPYFPELVLRQQLFR
ncbi:MAG: N-acetylmuramoyl-L-alanine amidase [Phycisphaeraceae bacterium]|nr:N-acetylmuramoyl-L-alanine amidase [Phycisphaeraceae bacterium]